MLASVVGLHSIIPSDAFSADTLGTERAGNGVLIDDGLVLTIGYLITEAETVWLHLGDGRVVQGHALGFDSESGFGLVQALGRIDLDPLPLGSSAAAKIGDRVVLGGAGGRTRSVASHIAAKQEFAGYWEYLLDEAIFTHPAHPNWGGTGLISNRGELIGIGSLQLEREREGKSEHVNMIVPIDLLKPVLDDLRKFGRVNKPARPWLGMYSTEIENKVVVVGISAKGPAARAELKAGDVILAVKGEKISSQAQFYRKLWSLGPAGVDVPLTVYHEGVTFDVVLASIDRAKLLKAPAAALKPPGLRIRGHAMSEAVVDDIVAVLPPLLQSLEALGFIARHLNPPDFGSVMEAAGTPDQALRAVRPRLADWPGNSPICSTSLETASDAALAAFEGLRAVQHGNGDLVAVFRALRHAPRAQEALYPLAAKLPPVSELLYRSRVARRRRSAWRVSPSPRSRKHRHHSRPQRARQPRRLLALRAGILHARPRLAAGDGVAWRQRQWPRLPVELAARRPQLRRHPGRADRDRQYLGLDGRRHRYAEPRPHSRSRAGTLEHRSRQTAADRA